MPPGSGASEVIMARGYWGEPTATIDWCEKNYEVGQIASHTKSVLLGFMGT